MSEAIEMIDKNRTRNQKRRISVVRSGYIASKLIQMEFHSSIKQGKSKESFL